MLNILSQRVLEVHIQLIVVVKRCLLQVDHVLVYLPSLASLHCQLLFFALNIDNVSLKLRYQAVDLSIQILFLFKLTQKNFSALVELNHIRRKALNCSNSFRCLSLYLNNLLLLLL